MKTLRFPQHPFARIATLAILFTLFGWALTAQTIGGTVFDECTGDPIGGATIRISVNIPGSPLGNWSFPTDPDGTWDFSFFGSDPNGPYTITVGGGASSPGSYFYYRNQGNNMGLNFDLLPKNWDFTINGEEVFWQNNPQSPHTICSNQDNCLQLTGTGDVLETSPDHCFQVRLYDTDASGQAGELLARSLCQNFSRPSVAEPCGDQAFDLNELLEGLETVPDVIRLEIWNFCCNRDCEPGEGGLVNKEVVFIEVSEIGPAQACFMMVDDMGLLVAPGEDCASSLSYCQIGVTLDGSCSSGQIDRYWIVINEYDLNTCDFIRTLADGTANPTSISSLSDLEGLPLNTYVLNHWVPSSTPIFPYFFTLFTGNPPANYEVTLHVENDCGVYSTTGWFDNTISNCFTGGGDDSQSFLTAPPFGNSQDTNISSQGFEKMVISPNPSTGHLKVEVQSDVEGNAMLTMLNTVGEVVLRTEIKDLEKGKNSFAFDVFDFPDGLYYISLNGQMGRLYSSFVKN